MPRARPPNCRMHYCVPALHWHGCISYGARSTTKTFQSFGLPFQHGAMVRYSRKAFAMHLSFPAERHQEAGRGKAACIPQGLHGWCADCGRVRWQEGGLARCMLSPDAIQTSLNQTFRGRARKSSASSMVNVLSAELSCTCCCIGCAPHACQCVICSAQM